MDNKTIEERIKEYDESIERSAERVRRLQGEEKRIQSQIVQAVDERNLLQGAAWGLRKLLKNDPKPSEAALN